MSSQQWPAAPAGSGSVKRARERAMSGSNGSNAGKQAQKGPPRKGDSPPRSRPPMPAALADAQGSIGVAISKPTQVPQWPLTGNIAPTTDQQSSYQPPPGRGAPPQRPQRPSNVPSILDASKIQEPTPSFPYRPPQDDPSQPTQDELLSPRDDNMLSPGAPSPMTLSSRPSTISSMGTIPDFPVPAMPPGPPRRSANLGPPPSSRRGGTSFYSQSSLVSPIPEENSRGTSHVSYASSAAIPTSWGSASPVSPGYEDDEFRDVDRGEDGPIEEGRESREDNFVEEDEKALVRSASLGKRAKPSVVTTKGVERSGSLSRQQSDRRVNVDTKAAQAALAAAIAGATKSGDIVWPMLGSPDSSFTTGTGFVEKSSSSSSNGGWSMAQQSDSRSGQDDIPVERSNRASQILDAYQAASTLQPRGVEPSRTPSPFNRLSAIRRPPRLNIDAVREAEARGSLTSLPDLIKRATRLAAMMDRGKRPASRLNELNDFALYSNMAAEKEMGGSDDTRQSGLSGMLAAFPPPGVATPVRNQAPQRESSWPYVVDDHPAEERGQRPVRKQRRCCCGLPAWAVLLLLLLILVIIAAAVVVPIEILVVHKNKSTNPGVSPLTQCQQNITCANGGTNVIDSGVCSCLCTNGFTGSTCTIPGAAGCTTTDISSAITNVTIGEAIPRLISQGQQNFSIPLNPTIILAEFNDASLSCASENALVTFDGVSEPVARGVNVAARNPTKTARVARRYYKETYSSDPPSATEDGIIIDPDPSPSVYHSQPSTSTTSTPTSTPSSTPSSKPTPVSAGPIPSTSSTNFVITQEALDFARVAVLFILQQDDLDAAVIAQSSLQRFFTKRNNPISAASNITVGNGNIVNLSGFNLIVSNGTRFGLGV
ncbi:hypothetical protein F5884DRAFT_494425 [Xylogone sp. PMI_703]|nr:hypothetical protein F5884DRAFT_494425 [Xylogone sp. PMI_703]